MASEWTETGRFTERNGKVVGVEHQDGDVRIVIRAQVKGGPVLTQIVMGGEHRDAFLRLLAAAEFAAERHERGASRPQDCNTVERAARALIGIPEGL